MRRALLLASLFSLALPAAAQNCDTALADASEQYRTGYFDEAIERLTACLERNAFSAEERRRVYRLLGLSYIGKDREQDAREAVRALLEVAPDYQPDPALDPPPFVQMVREMNRSAPPPSDPAGTIAGSQSVSTTRGFMGSLNAMGTRYSDSDDDSAGGAGLGLTLGYGFSPAVTLYVQLSGTSSSDLVSDIDEIGEITTGEARIGSAGVGGRFHIGGGRRKLVPFIGAGASYQTLSLEFNENAGGGSDEYSGPGGTLAGGLLYFVSPALALNGGLHVLFSSLTSDQADRTISATTVSFGAGVSWTPGW